MEDGEAPLTASSRRRQKQQRHQCSTGRAPSNGSRHGKMQPLTEMPEVADTGGGSGGGGSSRALYRANRVELKASRLLPRPTPLPQSRWSNSQASGGSSSIGGGVASFYARLRLAGGPRRSAAAAFEAATTEPDGGEEVRSSTLYLRPGAPQSLLTVVAPGDEASAMQHRRSVADSATAWRSTASSFVHRQKLMKCDTAVSRALSSGNSSQSTVQ
uniref:Uncharacterized protein n=1 Tax=Macrostomum lignano TaxID=282301 RepID=A0A1I8GRZ7_9PLAT